MKSSKPLIHLTIFSAGLLIGAALTTLVEPAHADAVNWADIAEDPGFRAAVVDVINSCIVDNAIIYCN